MTDLETQIRRALRTYAAHAPVPRDTFERSDLPFEGRSRVSRLPRSVALASAAVLVAAVVGLVAVLGRSRSSPRAETTTVSISVVTVLASDAPRVALVERFLAAFNAGDTTAVLAMFNDNPSVSDCDYAKISVVELRGRSEVTAWLEARIADHDQLVPRAISNENPDPATSAIGVEFARRTNDTLRRLGFPQGIKPQLATKVAFTGSGDGLRIATFALGPGGGLSSYCKPK